MLSIPKIGMVECAQCRFLQGAVFAVAIGCVGAFAPLSPYVIYIVVNGFSIFSSVAIFTSPSVCWLYDHYVCCWKIRLKNGMSKKRVKKKVHGCKNWKQTTGRGNTTRTILVIYHATRLWCFAILPTNCGNGRAWSSLLVSP